MKNGSMRFKCPFCGQISEGAAQYAGTEENCPSCGKRFQLVAMGEPPSASSNFLMCYLGMFKRYVGFRGRAARREFWWAILCHTIATVIIVVIDGAVFSGYRDPQGLLVQIYFFATLLPVLAIQSRRLHDTNKSGWWVLLSIVPVLNIVYIVWLATAGDKGCNRFGEDSNVISQRGDIVRQRSEGVKKTWKR